MATNVNGVPEGFRIIGKETTGVPDGFRIVNQESTKIPDGFRIIQDSSAGLSNVNRPKKTFLDKFSDAIAGSSVAKSAALAGRELLDSYYNPVGVIAKGINKIQGGRYELPESLRLEGVKAETPFERAVERGAGYASDMYSLAGVGGILKGAGALGKGTNLMSKIMRGVLAPENVGSAVSAAARGGALEGAINPESTTGKILANITGAMFPNIVRGAVNTAGNIAAHGLGFTTGTGSGAIKQAYSAGKTGSKVFKENLRGNVDMQDVVFEARNALQKMKIQKNAQYKEGIGKVFKAPEKVALNPVLDTFRELKKDMSYKGFSSAGDSTKRVVGKISKILNEFSKNKGVQDVRGFDALKQRIGDILVDLNDKGAKRIRDIMYNAVSGEIKKQAPEYAKIMRGYETAARKVGEIEKALSLGKSADTALRKLQSVFKDNVASNFGNRTTLARQLDAAAGGGKIMDALAGQSLSSKLPRGLRASLFGTGIGGLGLAGGSAPLLLAIPAFSPRAVGEAARAAGQVARRIPSIRGGVDLSGAFRAGVTPLISKKSNLD